MIEINSEDVFRLTVAPKRLPHGRNDKPINMSTVFRWAQRGVRGGIRLETIRIGGALHTSSEALQRFAERLSASDGHRATRSSHEAAKASEQAASELDVIGI